MKITFSIKPIDEQTDEPLNIGMVSEKIHFGHMLSLALRIGDVYKAAGGSGIKVSMVRSLEDHLENESPYEVLNGTPFANTVRRWRDVEGGSLIKRSQVYKALEVLAGANAQNLRSQLNTCYPSEVWQDSFPLESIFEYLLNTYQSELRPLDIEEFDRL